MPPAAPRAQCSNPAGVQEPTGVLLERDYAVFHGCKERSRQQPAPQKWDAELFKMLLGRSQPGSGLWPGALALPLSTSAKVERMGTSSGQRLSFAIWAGHPGMRDSPVVALFWYDLRRGALCRSPAVGLSPALALGKWMCSPAWGQGSTENAAACMREKLFNYIACFSMKFYSSDYCYQYGCASAGYSFPP